MKRAQMRADSVMMRLASALAGQPIPCESEQQRPAQKHWAVNSSWHEFLNRLLSALANDPTDSPRTYQTVSKAVRSPSCNRTTESPWMDIGSDVDDIIDFGELGSSPGLVRLEKSGRNRRSTRITSVLAVSSIAAAVALGVYFTSAPSVRKTPNIGSSKTVPFVFEGKGFDTCSAPSTSAMKAWKSEYSAIGIWIGGENVACPWGNLSASWVKTVKDQGWTILPIYAGPQAPENSFFSTITRPAAQGIGAAKTARAELLKLGLPTGTPVFYDMESYDPTKASNISAVTGFINAWDKQLDAYGYYSGVVMPIMTIPNIVAAGNHIRQPDVIWFCDWDNSPNPNRQYIDKIYKPRSNGYVFQYRGNVTETHGGFTLNIDVETIDIDLK